MKLVRCDHAACGRVYHGESAMIEVTMWGRKWQFCSGTCLDDWSTLMAQHYWTNYGKDLETTQQVIE